MRANSLAFRLFLWATGLTVVVLIVTGFALSSLYRHAVERAFDRRLDVYLRTLVADVASPDEGAEKFPQTIGEPLFELPFGLVLASHASRYAKARAAFLALAVGSNLPRVSASEDASAGGYRKGYAKGPEDVRLRLVERNVDLADEGRYLIQVAGDASEIDGEMLSFDRPSARYLPRWRRALVDHGVAGPLRPVAAETNFRKPRRHPFRPRGAAGGRISRGDRAAGARDQCADRRQP